MVFHVFFLFSRVSRKFFMFYFLKPKNSWNIRKSTFNAVKTVFVWRVFQSLRNSVILQFRNSRISMIFLLSRNFFFCFDFEFGVTRSTVSLFTFNWSIRRFLKCFVYIRTDHFGYVHKFSQLLSWASCRVVELENSGNSCKTGDKSQPLILFKRIYLRSSG